jgi:hypothetical protein
MIERKTEKDEKNNVYYADTGNYSDEAKEPLSHSSHTLVTIRSQLFQPLLVRFHSIH